MRPASPKRSHGQTGGQFEAKVSFAPASRSLKLRLRLPESGHRMSPFDVAAMLDDPESPLRLSWSTETALSSFGPSAVEWRRQERIATKPRCNAEMAREGDFQLDLQ